MEKQKIASIASALIVGGGIGGMATAMALAERGVSVDLIDLDPEWRVYGAGITITGVTLRAYKHFDMVKDIAAKGAITTGVKMHTYKGELLQDLDTPQIEEDLPATSGIMRPVLHRIMQERIRALDIPVRLGLTVTALENNGSGVDVTFSDGTRGRYDLVVGSDSVYSGVRKLAFPHMSEPEPTGQGCWRISMKQPPGLDKDEFFLGHEYTAGITRCGDDAMYMFLLTPHVRRERHFDDEELYTNLKANLAAFGGKVGWVRDNMTREDWINYRPLAAKLQPRPWSNGRVVLLGDSVHATTPHLASGAGMAVESALVLADELAQSSDTEVALKAYEERRYERCRDVVESSITIGQRQLERAPPEEVGELIGAALHRLAAPF